MAKRRLAYGYHAAQERGEVRTQADNQAFSQTEKAGFADIGLTGKDIHEAREIRDAEEADPRVIRRTLDTLIEAGEEPTKAAVNREIVNWTSFTGNNDWFTPREHMVRARKVLGKIDLDPASH